MSRLQEAAVEARPVVDDILERVARGCATPLAPHEDPVARHDSNSLADLSSATRQDMLFARHTRHSFVASSSSALLSTDARRSTVGSGTREHYGRLVSAVEVRGESRQGYAEGVHGAVLVVCRLVSSAGARGSLDRGHRSGGVVRVDGTSGSCCEQ